MKFSCRSANPWHEFGILSQPTKSVTPLSAFALLVIGFNVLAAVVGLSMPRIIQFEAQAKFADFDRPEWTNAYIDEHVSQRMPEIVLCTTLSIFGVYLGCGLLRRRERARKAWLVICIAWVAIGLLWQIKEPDLSLLGIGPLLLRIVILIASCRVLLNDAVVREFGSAS